MENDGGCFVTKVSPDGSAARSGGVEIGDQLAAINGQSSIKIKVDGICDAIANSPDSSQVDMVFLRYIGPFRAAKNTRKGGIGEKSRSIKRALFGKNDMVRKNDAVQKSDAGPTKTTQKKVGIGFRLFGRGKTKGDKVEAKSQKGPS